MHVLAGRPVLAPGRWRHAVLAAECAAESGIGLVADVLALCAPAARCCGIAGWRPAACATASGTASASCPPGAGSVRPAPSAKCQPRAPAPPASRHAPGRECSAFNAAPTMRSPTPASQPVRLCALLVHVQAQHFDEQHLGQLGQHARAAGPRRTRFGQRVAHRGFEPHARSRAAHIDPHHRRQPRQQHARQARIAGEVAADDARGRRRRRRRPTAADAATAPRSGVRPARAPSQARTSCDAHRPAGTEPRRPRSGAAARWFSSSTKHSPSVTRWKTTTRSAPGSSNGATESALPRLVAPRRGESGIEEDRAHQADDAQGFGQGVHQPASTSMCKAKGAAACTALGMGDRRQPVSTSTRNRPGDASCARMRTRNCTSPGPANTGWPSPSFIPSSAAGIRPAAGLDLERLQFYPRLGRGHGDAGSSARSQACAEQPARRDMVATAAEFCPAGRWAGGCHSHDWSRPGCRPANGPLPARRPAGPSADGVAGPPAPAVSPPQRLAWSWPCLPGGPPWY